MLLVSSVDFFSVLIDFLPVLTSEGAFGDEMNTIPYQKSALCSLLIKETADVSVAIGTQNVAWGVFSLGDAKIRPVEVWGGVDPPPLSQPLSVSGLVFGEKILSVQGFSIPVVQTGQGQGLGGVGPVHSGLIQLDLYLWATHDAQEVALSIDRSVDVKFRFGNQDWAPIVWAQTAVLQWPSAI